MFIHLSAGIVFAYLLLRFVLPLRVGMGVKTAAALLLLLVSQQHFLVRTFFGSLSSPELPAAVLLFQGWSFISLLFLFVLILAGDLVSLLRLITRRIKPNPPPAFSPDRRRAFIACLAVVPAAYGVEQAVELPGVLETEARLPRLPAELDGLNLVQVSDLHAGPLLREPWVKGVVERVNALKPDLLLFTGDMVDGTPSRRIEDVAPLKDLRARFGIYGCVGNHEYYGDYPAWMRTFPRLGLKLLLNAHETLTIRGKNLVLAGLTDIAAARYGLPTPDLEAALAGAPENTVRILLNHRPENARKHANAGFDLKLCGHTHGGQILGMNRLVARFNDGYLYGWYQIGAMPMYVSSGAGLWNGFPARLGVPSEIVRIVLRRV